MRSIAVTPSEVSGAVVCRCSSKQVFLKFTKFTEKHICRNLFMKNLLNGESNASVFLWNLLNFQEHLSHRTTLMVVSEVFCKDLIDISYKKTLFRILEDSRWLQIIYFSIYNCIFVCKLSFSDQWNSIN